MPLGIDVNPDRKNEQHERTRLALFPPLHLNLCSSQQHQGLWFPVAKEPVSAERRRYVRFICCNYEVLFLEVSLMLQHFRPEI